MKWIEWVQETRQMRLKKAFLSHTLVFICKYKDGVLEMLLDNTASLRASG